MRSFEMCAGAGGLALATTQAGFTPVALLENNPFACETLNENRRRGCRSAKAWPADITPVDICKFDYSKIQGPIDLLSGGPPCQPFSIGGKHLGIDDDRDLFGEVARAIRHLRPRAVLIENTKGLSRPTFAKQLRYIELQMSFPTVRRKPREHWINLLSRLELKARTSRRTDVAYSFTWEVHNAADYGVPQQRERLILVGFEGRSAPPFVFPTPTHSFDALLRDQWVTGEYWERHRVATRDRPPRPERLKARIERVAAAGTGIRELPWVTVRDAIATLPEPFVGDGEPPVWNHRLQPGARAYPKHTGSCIDLPAKALKAGRHGVPGGENMIAFPDGSVRYFTIRECARLQSFPDDYVFNGSWKQATRQLGNAVPVSFCRSVAEGIRARLEVLDAANKKGAVA